MSNSATWREQRLPRQRLPGAGPGRTGTDGDGRGGTEMDGQGGTRMGRDGQGLAEMARDGHGCVGTGRDVHGRAGMGRDRQGCAGTGSAAAALSGASPVTGPGAHRQGAHRSRFMHRAAAGRGGLLGKAGSQRFPLSAKIHRDAQARALPPRSRDAPSRGHLCWLMSLGCPREPALCSHSPAFFERSEHLTS